MAEPVICPKCNTEAQKVSLLPDRGKLIYDHHGFGGLYSCEVVTMTLSPGAAPTDAP